MSGRSGDALTVLYPSSFLLCSSAPANGDCFSGTWQAGQRNRHVRYTFHGSGDVYEGDMLDDLRQGTGRYTFQSSGDTYEGGYERDLYHGHGTLTSQQVDPSPLVT